MLISYAAYPTIIYPTRIAKNSKSLIDNFFVNRNYLWQSGVLDCNLSDHETIFLSIDIPVPKSRSYDHISKFFSCKLFCKYISPQQFDFVTDISCVNEDCKHFVECLMRSVAYATLPGETYNNSRYLWITAALIVSIKHKQALFKSYVIRSI